MTTSQSLFNLNCEVHALLVEDGRCTCFVVAKVPTPEPVLVRPKKRFTIMSDADCNSFYIPTEKETDFEAWVASLRTGEQYNGEDFSDYRIGGAIFTAMFSSSLVN
jgi:hypothetical protein